MPAKPLYMCHEIDDPNALHALRAFGNSDEFEHVIKVTCSMCNHLNYKGDTPIPTAYGLDERPLNEIRKRFYYIIDEYKIELLVHTSSIKDSRLANKEDARNRKSRTTEPGAQQSPLHIVSC